MRYLLFGVLVAAVTGCSSPNNPALTTTEQAVLISPYPPLVNLEPGGLAIQDGGDTAVNFDLVSNYSVYNDSNVSLHLLAKWSLTGDTPALQEIKPNETSAIGFPVLDTGTIDLGIIPAGSSVTLDSIPVVALPDSIGSRVNYSVQFQVQNGPLIMRNSHTSGLPDSISTVSTPLILFAFNVSVPFASRWHGILHTVESSPTVIDTIDSPDDGDWIDSGILAIKPIVPNPAVGATTFQFTLLQAADSVRLLLDETPHHILRAVSLGSLQAGAYIQQLDLTSISPGLFRTFLIAYKNGVVSQIRGDIMVPQH